jgi:hypothetical protein
MEPDDPARVCVARRYWFTVPVLVMLSPSVAEAEMLENVTRSTQVALSAECCTLMVLAPSRVFAVTWRLARAPLVEVTPVFTEVTDPEVPVFVSPLRA